MKTLGKMVFLCCAALLAPVPVAAAEAWQWDAGVGADMRWFDWREHQSDRQLLMEYGPMYSLAGQLRVQKDVFYSSLDAGIGGGMAHYDGHLQTGEPYEADAWELLSDAEWQLGVQGESGNVHVGLMNRFWHRLIEGEGNVSSAEEEYDWLLFNVGGGLRIYQGQEWRVDVMADVGTPLSSKQTVYSDEFGDFQLEPGDGLFWRVALPLRRGNLLLRPYYQQQDMDESESVLQRARSNGQYYQLYQPASVRRELGLGVLWYFGGASK